MHVFPNFLQNIPQFTLYQWKHASIAEGRPPEKTPCLGPSELLATISGWAMWSVILRALCFVLKLRNPRIRSKLVFACQCIHKTFQKERQGICRYSTQDLQTNSLTRLRYLVITMVFDTLGVFEVRRSLNQKTCLLVSVRTLLSEASCNVRYNL